MICIAESALQLRRGLGAGKNPVQDGQNGPFSRERLIPKRALNLTAEKISKKTGVLRYELDPRYPASFNKDIYCIQGYQLEII